jgi:hypothetical protein
MIVSVLIFLLGAQLGLIVAAVACVRYVRQELTANITPRVDLLDARVAHVQAKLELALTNLNNASMNRAWSERGD